MKKKRKFIRFDIRPFTVGDGYISIDPNVMSRYPESQLLLDDHPWSVSNPLNLFKDESSVNDYLDENMNVPHAVEMCFLCSEITTAALVDYFGTGWVGNLMLAEEMHSSGWIFYGFDVADLRGLFSAINGFDQGKLYEQVKGTLNIYGLFDKINDANDFAEAMGCSVPTHFPFIVIDVYLRGKVVHN